MKAGRRLVVGALAAAAVSSLLGASTASAHPLGNFSINHAHALRLTPDRIVDEAIIDVAEIPTAQAERSVDTDGNGTFSPEEMARYGESRCDALLDDVRLTVDGGSIPFTITRTSFERVAGTAGLATSRLECTLEAAVDLTRSSTVEFADQFETNRVGWQEVTAIGDGVTLVDSPVPTQSTTDGLRNYPVDLLSSPLDVREASFAVEPGTLGPAPSDDLEAATSRPNTSRSLAEGGPVARVVDRITDVFDDLIGRRDLTLGVGLIAVALAIVLGASHALLPGHGKTVMAAYIAGRQGTARDAVVVGATVTATHTGGVLLLGLALTISSSLAGETVLAWLGVASGMLIAGLGASLLIGSARHRPSGLHRGHHHGGHGHHHHGGGHTHSHAPGLDGHNDDHDAAAHAPPPHKRILRATPRPASAPEGQTRPTRVSAVVRHTSVGRISPAVAVAERPRTARTTVVDRKRAPAPDSPPPPVSRRALVGMGIAGGLVPSPSALIVLLSAIALGRTAFGILLVIGYGVGMAATLTAAGLLLVRIRDRYQRRTLGRAGRKIGAAAARWQTIMPYLTAMLVLLVGLGLALRSVYQLD